MDRLPRPPLTPHACCGQLVVMPRPSVIPVPQAVRIQKMADVSEKTWRRYLAGVSVLASTMRRIEAALRAEGLERLIDARAEKVRANSAAA